MARAGDRQLEVPPVYQPEAKDAWMAAHPPGAIEYVEAIGPKERYGKWLRSRPAAVRVGDTVFVHGWAYGEGGTALVGKRFLWAVTTGGDESTYGPDGAHRHPFEAFIAPMRQTAQYCGMRWEAPFILHGAHVVDDTVLAAHVEQYRDRLTALSIGKGDR